VCWDEAFLESFPVQAHLELQATAISPCTAAVVDLQVDLSRLRDAYRTAYQSRSGTIVVSVGAVSDRYEF
jgi:hypothetical protein